MKAKPLLYIFCLFLCKTCAFADTICLKDGKEIKGIIVEDYTDRVVISTFKGEKTVFKNAVKNILYDTMEQNLVKMGDKYLARREYENAYFYYEKAHKTNRDYKVARERMSYVMGYLFRTREQAKLSDIQRRQEFEDWPASKTIEEDFEKKLEGLIGIQIAEEEGLIKIKKVVKDSTAFIAGLKPNDRLISIWGQLTGYMSGEEIELLLLEESFGEIKIGIERNVVLKKEKPRNRDYRDIIGGKMDMLLEGLTIVDIAEEGAGQRTGFKKGDLIIAINGVQTRYMPLKDAIGIIEDKEADTINFTIRREMTMWRKE